MCRGVCGLWQSLQWCSSVCCKEVSPVASQCGADSTKFLQWHSSVGLFQLSFSSGVPVYTGSTSGNPVYTGPASVHWLRVRDIAWLVLYVFIIAFTCMCIGFVNIIIWYLCLLAVKLTRSIFTNGHFSLGILLSSASGQLDWVCLACESAKLSCTLSLTMLKSVWSFSCRLFISTRRCDVDINQMLRQNNEPSKVTIWYVRICESWSSVYSTELIVNPETGIKNGKLQIFLIPGFCTKRPIEIIVFHIWYFTYSRRLFALPSWVTTSHLFSSNIIYILVATIVVRAHAFIIDQQQISKWIYIYIYWCIPFLL